MAQWVNHRLVSGRASLRRALRLTKRAVSLSGDSGMTGFSIKVETKADGQSCGKSSEPKRRWWSKEPVGSKWWYIEDEEEWVEWSDEVLGSIQSSTVIGSWVRDGFESKWLTWRISGHDIGIFGISIAVVMMMLNGLLKMRAINKRLEDLRLSSSMVMRSWRMLEGESWSKGDDGK